jgi:hypothetical protein
MELFRSSISLLISGCPLHRDILSVPLSPLEGLNPNKKNKQVMEDWQYWVERGYQL